MKKFNPIEMFHRWRRSRAELLADLDRLRLENEQLRNKVATLQHAKEQAERSLDERRREKQVLRSRLNSEKKSSVSKEIVTQQLSDKVAELREENDRLLRSKKRKGTSELSGELYAPSSVTGNDGGDDQAPASR